MFIEGLAIHGFTCYNGIILTDINYLQRISTSHKQFVWSDYLLKCSLFSFGLHCQDRPVVTSMCKDVGGNLKMVFVRIRMFSRTVSIYLLVCFVTQGQMARFFGTVWLSWQSFGPPLLTRDLPLAHLYYVEVQIEMLLSLSLGPWRRLLVLSSTSEDNRDRWYVFRAE